MWPKRWAQGIIFPLYKDGSRLAPGNYRPIALLSVVGKLFGSVIENRLSDWSEKTMALADSRGASADTEVHMNLFFSFVK